MPPYVENASTGGRLSAQVDLGVTDDTDGDADGDSDRDWNVSFTPVSVLSNPFCAGHSQLGSGNILVVGGDNQDWPLTGPERSVINGRQAIREYEMATTDGGLGRWSDKPSMTTRRWYPVVITLADGSAMIIGGQTKNIDFDNLAPQDQNPTYEYYPSKGGSWPRYLDILAWAYPHNLYPPSFLLPSGRVFCLVSNKSIIIDPSNENIINLPDMPPSDHSPWIYPHTPTMFPLPMTISNNWEFKLMICGGSKLPLADGHKDASAECLTIKPDDPEPQWSIVTSMPHARVMPDSVILPDGTVLLVNGLSAGQAGGNQGQVQYATGPVYETDLYNPITNTWTTLAPASQMRLYHSGALLLETGHVITVGSEMDNYYDYWSAQPDLECYPRGQKVCTSPFNHHIERFTPPYLQSTSARLRILQSPKYTTHGSLIELTVDRPQSVYRASFLRMGTTTHSTNTDQRMVELVITHTTDSRIFLEIPTNPGIATVGNWFIFLLDDANSPSKAATIHLRLGDPERVIVPSEAKKFEDSPASSEASGLFAGSSPVWLLILTITVFIYRF